MRAFASKQNFPQRNYIIASFSLATVVVEASERSGALITANWASEENRQVFAVPGDIYRETSRGTNKLIQAGAKLVQNYNDVVEELEYMLEGMLRQEKEKVETKRMKTLSLSEAEERIYNIIKREPISVDALLAAEFNGEYSRISELSTILLNLEMKQLIKQLPGKVYMVRQ
jgi:DNA processing protein